MSAPRAQVSIAGALLLLCAALSTGGCRNAGPPRSELVVLNETPVQRLDPRFVLGAWDAKLSALVAPGLVSIDNEELRPAMDLAESVEALDDLTYVATLRTDARFPDGRVVEAEDVRYTFTSVLEPALGSPHRKTFDDMLAGVDVLDGRRVRFRLRRPRAPFITDLTFGIVDSRAARPQDDALIAAARAGRRPPPFDPLHEVSGAGPYRIAERGTDTVVLARNPYARTPARMEKVAVRTIRDDNARFLALMGGSGDMIQNGIPPLVLETFEHDPRLHVLYGPSVILTYLGFNANDPALGNPLVRRAISMAIDRQRIIASKFRGHARLASSPLDDRNPYHDPAAVAVPYDVEQAKRLLDQAGLRDPDGDGPEPRLRLTWKTSAQRFRVALAQVMARQLADIGIAVEVRPFDFATFMDDVKKGNYQIFSLQMSDVIEPDMLRALFHSSRIPTESNTWTGLNRFRYRDAKLDELLEAGAATRDPERRKELYAQAQKVLARDLPMLPLWFEDNVAATARRVHGYELHPPARLSGVAATTKD